MGLIDDLWYGGNRLAFLLWPLSLLFQAVAGRRRRAYLEAVAQGRLWRPPVPVLVVGNISVGGTGKTPVVVALVEHLRRQGYRPGVVSRGYGGHPDHLPLSVTGDTPAAACGDEPLLVHLRTGCPVVIDPDRPAAVRQLLAQHGCDVVISDDGLQHYALYRDVEIAVVDGQRGLGNGLCLPAGPLREPPARLRAVDAVLLNGGGELAGVPSAAAFQLAPARLVGVLSGGSLPCDAFGAGASVHAVAGIGNPGRFFATLQGLGLAPEAHPFPDHHRFTAADVNFGDDRPVIMTEKDAVKCREFAGPQHWFLAVDAQLPAVVLDTLVRRLAAARHPVTDRKGA